MIMTVLNEFNPSGIQVTGNDRMNKAHNTMERIPAKDRFSQNQKSVSIAPKLLRESLKLFGMNPTAELQQLSGGFMNANFLASDEGQSVVLRIYSTDSYTAQKEFDLLKFMEAYPVTTPKVFANFEIENRPVVVMEFLNGITLEDKILSGDHFGLGIFEDIGGQLGEIHKIHFQDAGFIGPKMEVGKEYESFALFLRQFIDKTLKDLETRQDKLDLETNGRLRRLVQDKWELALQTEPIRQLVHCDFNPKNILVSNDINPKVVGIIDWEFIASGNGLIDIGNFFRFSYDYPQEARERFIHGYRTANPTLPSGWADAARLLDLANMCSFLERKEDYQKSFRTARVVIKSTLEHFGY